MPHSDVDNYLSPHCNPNTQYLPESIHNHSIILIPLLPLKFYFIVSLFSFFLAYNYLFSSSNGHINYPTSTSTTTTTSTTCDNSNNEATSTDINNNTNSNNNNNNNAQTNGNGGDDTQELRPLLISLITTIRAKLDLIEADVERVTTLDELNSKKHYLTILQEITRILSAFPRSDGYEAKELPESFSGKPRLIAFRNNMNFMLWENNSKLHLINDYVTSTHDTANKLSLVFSVVDPIKTV